ncbi:MAG: phosphoglucomutase [Roseiflexaceae bacterium]
MPPRPRVNHFDWEGVFSADFTLSSFQRRCQRVAEVLLAHKWSCLIAHDTRFMAEPFARYAFYSLAHYGARVSYCPTPAPFPAIDLALGQRRADTALIISAGNRPFWYNGMIVLAPLEDSPLEGDPSAEQSPIAMPFPPLALDASDNTQVDLRAPYIEMLRDSVDMDLIHRATLTVFVDPMSGATSGYIPATLGDGGQTKAIEINRETDPLFGRQPPQPTEASLNRLRKLVKESDSHLGVALSADGRAISVADNMGEIVPPLDLALLLAQYLSRQYRQRGAVIAPAPDSTPDASVNIRTWEEASGLKVELSSDPAARIAELLKQDRNSLLVGTTASGEVTLGRYSAAPDATLVALVLIESVARAGSRLRALLDDMKGKPGKT